MIKKLDIHQIIQLVRDYIAAFKHYSSNLFLRLCLSYNNIGKNFLITKEQAIKLLLPLIVVCLGFYSCVSSHRIINKNIDEIFMISDQIRGYYAGKPDYWGLSTSEIIQNRVIADKFLVNDKIMISGNKEIFIGQGKDAEIVMPRSTSFDIVLPKLTKAQCMAYAETELSSENEVKLIRIQITNNNGTSTFEWGGESGLPIKKYASKDVCADNGNTLIWSVK